MSLAVSTTEEESRAARLYTPPPCPLIHPEAARTAAAAIEWAIAELHAEPEKYAHWSAGARSDFICDAARLAVRALNVGRRNVPEIVP